MADRPPEYYMLLHLQRVQSLLEEIKDYPEKMDEQQLQRVRELTEKAEQAMSEAFSIHVSNSTVGEWEKN